MIKVLIYFIGAFFFCVQIVGQERPRYRVVTTKKGEYDPSRPKPESKRYKIKRFPGSEIEYKLYFQEFRKGIAVTPYATDENGMLLLRRNFSKNDSIIVEMIPELINSDQECRVHYAIPGVQEMIYRFTKEEGKCMKYVFFKSFDVISDVASSPVLLIYEDDKSTNENEVFIRKYLKNGQLPNTKKMEETVRQHIETYYLLYYTTKKIE